MLRLWVFAVFFAVASPALAQEHLKHAKHQKGGIVLNLPPVEDKTLGDSDGMPKWNEERVNQFCGWRKEAHQEDEKQCRDNHKKKIGRKMTIGEKQEMDQFRAAQKSKGAGRAKKMAGKKGKPEKKPENTHTGVTITGGVSTPSIHSD